MPLPKAARPAPDWTGNGPRNDRAAELVDEHNTEPPGEDQLSKLGAHIREIKGEHKLSLKALTVLAANHDPYRLDTPSGHRDGQWFLAHYDEATKGRPPLHLRGFHYILVARGNIQKPNGKQYINSDDDWSWLQEHAAKAARWLGYLPFNRIRDARNDPPIIHRADATEAATPYITSRAIHIDIPSYVEVGAMVSVCDFHGRQPYHLVIFGEKSSLADVVLPIAYVHNADVYLPSGEITDTLLYTMASDGAEDGRPMVVFTLSDADPAGYQMPVSIGRKLQALRDLEFPDLVFEVRPVALTVEQVKSLGLPSTPLKASELRADRWRKAFGIEQTEIDALAALRPDTLRQILLDAIRPFIDPTLGPRVRAAHDAWLKEAQERLDARLDHEMLSVLREKAGEKLEDIREQVDELKELLDVPLPYNLDLPEIVIPEPVIDKTRQSTPLVSSSWSWLEMTAALKRYRSYEPEDAS